MLAERFGIREDVDDVSKHIGIVENVRVANQIELLRADLRVNKYDSFRFSIEKKN
jgi:hypothetical protein